MPLTRLTLAAAALAALLGPLAALAAPAFPDDDIDGALTLLGQWGPDYLGARDRGVSVRPGFFLRWGRLSVSSSGGWATPRQDDEVRGLGLELTRSDRYRVNLGLRMDSGRDESSSASLAGMGDVRRTVRARISGLWRVAPQWELRGAWTVDAFGRGGGNLGEAKVQHNWPLSEHLHLTTGAALTLAGDRYLQTYYGVTPEQSARSGYPVFTPGMSLRDLTLSSSLRLDLHEDWVAQVGVGYVRMLGDAADSPLVQQRGAWSLSAGIGWRF